MIFQQLLFADEVRALKDLHIEEVPVTDAELQLALQIIDQVSEDAYDPSAYEDEEKKRILEAIDQKIAGKQIVSPEPSALESGGGQVIDLMEALRASLKGKTKKAPSEKAVAVKKAAPVDAEVLAAKPRRPAKRAARKVEEAAPAKVRARK